MSSNNNETKEQCFIDDNCANCGHSSEAHHAGSGKCYACQSSKRCGKFVRKHEQEMIR